MTEMIIDVENDSIIPVIERWLKNIKGVVSIRILHDGDYDNKTRKVSTRPNTEVFTC